MERVYAWRAKDGKYFETAEECRTYEMKNGLLSFMAFDRYGKPTSSPSAMFLVWIKDREGAMEFIDACVEDDESHEGIDEGCVGLYYWNEWDDEYDYLPVDLREALPAVLAIVNPAEAAIYGTDEEENDERE